MTTVLEIGKYYRLDFGSGHEDNYMIGKFEKEDVCNYFWKGPRLKKWSKFPEHLDNSGYTIKACRSIKLATDEEIERLKKLIQEKQEQQKKQKEK